MTYLLAIGTRKGLWLARSEDRRSWTVDEPHFLMEEVHSTAIDTRGGKARLFAGSKNWHWGPTLLFSDDLGKTWSEPEKGSVRFHIDDEASVEAIWQIAPDTAGRAGVVWAGSQPSALWRSDDGGESFSLVRALWDHPHREKWEPGFGGQAIHTVLPHPADDQRVLVAMSTGGVYTTDDGGDSWRASNQGIKAYFFPEGQQFPEFGQCVHKVARDAVDPERLFAQNHHGVYRSDDGGSTWTSIADGLPSDFGFPVVTHPSEPETAWYVPLVADGHRFPPNGALKVWRTDDGGKSWTDASAGLPQTDFYNAVMRDAFSSDGSDGPGLYLGARDGTVFASPDGGESWVEVVRHLPDVLSVRAAELS